MKTIKILVSTLIIACIAISSSVAQPGNGRQGMRGQGIRGQGMGSMDDPAQGMMSKIPDLSDQQMSAIQKKRTEMRKEMLPLQNEMREKRAHLQTLRSQDNADLDAIHSTIDAIGGLRTTMAKQRATMHQEVRKILNEEQRVWLDTHAPMRRSGKRMNCR